MIIAIKRNYFFNQGQNDKMTKRQNSKAQSTKQQKYVDLRLK